MTETTITVSATIEVEGFHHWPDAPPHRYYLSATHRHLFIITAGVTVGGVDREVECHDLQAQIRTAIDTIGRPSSFSRGGLDFGARSCEAIAAQIIARLLDHYADRDLTVEVLEDGEAGAIVHRTP